MPLDPPCILARLGGSPSPTADRSLGVGDGRNRKQPAALHAVLDSKIYA